MKTHFLFLLYTTNEILLTLPLKIQDSQPMSVLPSKTDTQPTYEWLLSCPPETADYLEALLWTLPDLAGVEVVYNQQFDNAHDDQTQPEHLSHLKVFSASQALATAMATLFQQDDCLQQAGCQILSQNTLKPEDWSEQWKAHWKPTHIHPALTICPSWEVYRPQRSDEQIIALDPGSAFGTGSHETTALMLKALHQISLQQDFAQCAVLDVGTGSGILAIYAAMLGSRSIRGIDNDSSVIQVALENARLNGVDSVIEFSDTPLEELCHTRYEVIVTNIIAPVILELLPGMLLRLAPQGWLLLSGLIEKSVGAVEEKLHEAELIHIEKQQQGDWFSLVAQKS